MLTGPQLRWPISWGRGSSLLPGDISYLSLRFTKINVTLVSTHNVDSKTDSV